MLLQVLRIIYGQYQLVSKRRKKYEI